MANYTDFGLSVKAKLLGPPTRTQTWLVGEVRKATGLYVDNAYLSKILTGQRKAPKIVRAVRDVLDLPDGGQTFDECAERDEQEGGVPYGATNADGGGSA